MGKLPKNAGRLVKPGLTTLEQQAREQLVEELKRKAVACVAENKSSAAAVSGENAPLHMGYVTWDMSNGICHMGYVIFATSQFQVKTPHFTWDMSNLKTRGRACVCEFARARVRLCARVCVCACL